MAERFESPRFTTADAAGHERVAPEQAAALFEAQIEPLDERRADKRDHGIPLAMQLAVLGDAIVMLNGGRSRSGGWMNLQRGLGGEQHSRTPPDRHVVVQAIASKHSGPGATRMTYAAPSTSKVRPIRSGGSA